MEGQYKNRKVWKYGTYACMAAHIMVFTDGTMGLQTHGCTLRPPLKVFCEKDMRRSSKVYTCVPGVKRNDYMYCMHARRKNGGASGYGSADACRDIRKSYFFLGCLPSTLRDFRSARELES